MKFKTLVIGILLAAQAGVADEIPAEMLQLDLNRCKKPCVPSYGEKVCHQLCSCSVREFKKRMNFAEYLDLSSRLVSNDLKASQRKLLDDIANVCDKELKIPVPQPPKKPKAKPVS